MKYSHYIFLQFLSLVLTETFTCGSMAMLVVQLEAGKEAFCLLNPVASMCSHVSVEVIYMHIHILYICICALYMFNYVFNCINS